MLTTKIFKKIRLEYIVLAILIILTVFSRQILTVATGSEVPLAVVKGYSMCPTLREGDLVFTYKPSPEDISIGDIIIYSTRTGDLIIHRVVRIYKTGTSYYYITKGDNNEAPDPFRVTYEMIKGKVIRIGNSTFKIPYLGYLSLWIHRS